MLVLLGRLKDQATPLHLACSSSKLDTVRLLLDHGGDARAQNVDGWTPLHQLSPSVIDYYDYTMVSLTVQLLVERGADVNAQDKDQETPLHIACYRGDFEAALAFLDHSAELSSQNAYGQIPLH